jgi:hypothetical protein
MKFFLLCLGLISVFAVYLFRASFTQTQTLDLVGELLAGSARHTCGPDRRAARGVALFFARLHQLTQHHSRKF